MTDRKNVQHFMPRERLPVNTQLYAQLAIFRYIKHALYRARVVPSDMICLTGVLSVPRVDGGVPHVEPALMVGYQGLAEASLDQGIAFRLRVLPHGGVPLAYIVLECFYHKKYIRRAWEYGCVLPEVVARHAIAMLRTFAPYGQ